MRRSSTRWYVQSGLLLVVTLAVTLLTTACGDSDDEVDPIAAAERRVSAAEDEVTEAQASFDEATGTFCEDAEAYVTAIDRYGHVLDDTAATVGDVRTAGADLAEPREAANASAASVVETRDQLANAQEDLADAKIALAEAQSGTSAPRGASTTTTAPLLPAATVDRVEQAEADLAAASEGITDQTPLTEAGAQFNAAAFALEVAWLRVLDDADCLTSDQRSQAVTAVVQYTKDLQTALQAAGYYDGPIDGIYGPTTVEAVEALQTDEGLPTTGYADRATAAALDEKVKAANGEDATAVAASTASVQSTLKLAGYWTGPVDGVWTPELTEALESFQTELGVPATGAVDAATLQALEKAIAEAKTAATTTTSTTTAASTTTEG